MTIDTGRGHGGALRWGFASGSFEMTRPLTLALGASLLGATLLAGCATTAKTGGAGDDAQARAAGDPYPSTYAPIASPPGLISGATVLTGDRKSVVEGKSVSVRLGIGGRRLIQKKKAHNTRKPTSR